MAQGQWPLLVGAPALVVSFLPFCLIFLFLPLTGLSDPDVLWFWLVGLCSLLRGFASSISTFWSGPWGLDVLTNVEPLFSVGNKN